MVADEQDEADNEPHRPEDIQSRCAEKISGTSFYSRLARHGLEYGPAFQKVTDVWRRDGEAIARMTPSESMRSTDIDAALLDGCFQVLAATLPASNGHSHDMYLPVGVADLRVRDVLRRRMVPRADARRVGLRAAHRRR